MLFRVLLLLLGVLCSAKDMVNEANDKQNPPTSNVQVHYNETNGNTTIDYITTIIFDIDIVNNTTSSSIITENPAPSHHLTYEEENGPNCNCHCGVGNRKHRIVGGNVTRVNEFPWMGAMSRRGKFYCAGSLITRRHILTAAHCVHGFHTHEIRVVLGEHDRQNKNEPGRVERRVKSAKVNPGFDIYTFNNDIAVLQLDSPVDIGPSIRPACLPQNKKLNYTGKMGIVTGWGRTGERKPTSNLLRKVTVPILSPEICKNSGYMRNRITDNMLCAGYAEGNKDSCQGDSGGPMHISTNEGYLQLAGIVSWGRGCARPNYPGVYTKIVNYSEWIKEQIGDECVCQRPK